MRRKKRGRGTLRNWEGRRGITGVQGGMRLVLRGRKHEENRSGYKVPRDRYAGESCTSCRLKKGCTKAKGNRVLERKAGKARAGQEALRKQRSVERETVVGQLQGNQGFRRFLLRGTAKVSTASGLRALGYTMKQMDRIQREKTA
ncbi:MAG: transposase [Treponema sp.]|jgi:hypothetical protein|nr:transposase [Treponema sp.]